MKTFTSSKLYATMAAMALVAAVPAQAEKTEPLNPAQIVKNVVLVHGAFADASGWRAVYDILTRDGYNVSLVNQPETSVADDVAATQRIIDMQTGPVVLVGHSYGGVLITQAGADPKVKALVYVAAIQPDVGETILSLQNSIPAVSNHTITTNDGYIYIDPKHFHADFAADSPKALTDFMAQTQVFTAKDIFTTPVTSIAWRDKPSYGIVATEDHTVNPDLERWMYKRAKSHITEIKGAHAVYVSQPEAVAAVIETAARNVK